MAFDDIGIAPADAHLGVADTLLRFGAGVDRGDASLLASVFTDDAVVDFRPCGQKLGLDFPVLEGAQAVKRRAKLTPCRRPTLTPLALRSAVARRRSAEPLAERSA